MVIEHCLTFSLSLYSYALKCRDRSRYAGRGGATSRSGQRRCSFPVSMDQYVQSEMYFCVSLSSESSNQLSEKKR